MHTINIVNTIKKIKTGKMKEKDGRKKLKKEEITMEHIIKHD